MAGSNFFIENLTVQAWALSIWPYLLVNRLRRRSGPVRCDVFDGSSFAVRFAKASAGVLGIPVERLMFRADEMRDDDGLHVNWRLRFYDKWEAVKYAQAEPVYQELAQSGLLHGRLPEYLTNTIIGSAAPGQKILWRSLLLLEICLWKTRQWKSLNSAPVLFLEQRPWINAIVRYGSDHGVVIIPTPPGYGPRGPIRGYLPSRVRDAIRFVRRRFSKNPGLRSQPGNSDERPSVPNSTPPALTSDHFCPTSESKARILMECRGNLNLNQPELHSDLAFWQQSGLRGSDLIVTFSLPDAPLNDQIWEELTSHQIKGVALHPKATTCLAAPALKLRPISPYNQKFDTTAKGYKRESRWLNQQMADYHQLVSYWTGVFESLNVKIFADWHMYHHSRCAMGEALQSLGGITAIYQRSFGDDLSIMSRVGPNVLFAYPLAPPDLPSRSNQDVLYYVTTGFLGDHRYPMLRDSAQAVRERLQKQGAQRILAYFDDQTRDGGNWGDHLPMRKQYAFLLEKVLTEPWFGLLIKPKRPATLRQRLGPVAEMLVRAEATGRCYVYEGGTVFGSQPASAAALASDLALDNKVWPGSAAIDAAMAGVPTVVLDQEGWALSPIYRLGKGRVVFTDHESLWEALQQHWSTPGGVPGLGDWSPILDELDPFRDGRASERLGTYIQWLIEGFHDGLDRERVLAIAAQRYADAWGNDKVITIQGESRKEALHSEHALEKPLRA